MLLFHEVIRKICGRKVLRVDPSNTADARLVRAMDRVAGTAMRESQRMGTTNPVSHKTGERELKTKFGQSCRIET